MRHYTVKEIFFTLQGEGARAGQPAVFLRFSGCNLWSGHEEDRATAACRFCDTDFANGQRWTRNGLIEAVEKQWLHNVKEDTNRLVVITGGEPMLQLDEGLVEGLADRQFVVAIETNGTIPISDAIALKPHVWVTVSPKAGTTIRHDYGQELKLVFPQVGLMPPDLDNMKGQFEHYFLQPMDGDYLKENTDFAVEYCMEHPRWALSIQQHKILELP